MSKMLLDSEIAQPFSCGMCIFRMFRDLSIFSRAFCRENLQNQKLQMNILIRFLDSKDSKVAERYLQNSWEILQQKLC